ncbi:hypothetical protein FNW02_30725 [Komarekiella sp. 'clone 1']|uniref:Uncharacterized protein n=1 Tax=Komarekiella delphini-convector SJRDD-AB1 TaxID=2593771 RepID=A0AA40VUC9_9NOST|nr:hypothetical protein [Komarekiella delphini-convector]MBD6620054.1 hypothetical protein [Komarekiella delphini-convector SJRDD-AB1]
MTNRKQILYPQVQLDRNNKLVLRRGRRVFKMKKFIDRTLETAVIASLLFTGFAGVGAIGCWGMEIIELNTNAKIIFSSWYYQKNACLGGMLVSFSTFLGSSLLGASFSIIRDDFHK